jgi:hypothetical protein
LAVETKLFKLAVETKLIKLAVETKLVRLGVEMKGRIDEASSAGSMKLLMYLSSPAVVEIRLGDESKLVKLAVETKFIKLAVETKLRRLGVETTPGTEEIYPRVPNPTVVDVN